MSHTYIDADFLKSKPSDLFEVFCDICLKPVFRTKKNIISGKKRSKSKLDFCSISCAIKKPGSILSIKCGGCDCSIAIRRAEKKRSKSGLNFCSRSCAATYNNTHKTKGIRRSKLEIWLEEQLTTIYPNLEILYCQKDAINSELDVYIPSLKLAFECNGIFHYEPIYGVDKLTKTQNNDGRKFQACLERNIELCILDTSKVKYGIPRNFKPFLDIITSLIDMKLSLSKRGTTIP